MGPSEDVDWDERSRSGPPKVHAGWALHRLGDGGMGAGKGIVSLTPYSPLSFR